VGNFGEAVILITGGGAGIGAALATALSALGARVVVADVALAAVETLKAQGHALEAHQLDVTDGPAFAALVDDLVARHGRIDYVFNNAGVSVCGDARDLTLDHWRRVIDVNLMGVVHGTHLCYQHMTRQGHGHIVNIASLAGLVPFPTNAPYAATKHAVVGLTLSLRTEGEALGVKVSAVCPGFIASNIFSATPFINVDREALLKAMPQRSDGHSRLATIPGLVPGMHDRPGACLFAPRCVYVQASCVSQKPLVGEHAAGVRCHFPLQAQAHR
jgi:oligopeptide/dipeptide ABC transporter ATP-binding protein